ncbi:MAG TPA: SDR family NAD(P)-dependent oxidoreductase, partial [Burkholderiaceae bacterium]|nr:SDR family NAD(P)-dependent oxidoreductase [Burkholderiaceae bacterium]
IAEHCCRLWLERGPVDLTLVARDAARTERIAADLRVRGPASTVTVMTADFVDARDIARVAVSTTTAGPVDIVLIAHGALPKQELCSDIDFCRDTLEVNAVSPALFAEAFAGHFAKANHGTIAIIGSVAGDRGRKANYTYGASKGLIERYAQGLDHRFAGSGVSVVLLKPGPTDTPMSAEHKAKGRKLASAQSVAQTIVRGIDRRKAVVYAPPLWQLIMLIVRHLPRFIFNRLSI